MTTTNSYLDVARDYADGVRVLFSPAAASTRERGEPGATPPATLAAQAEKLAPLSSLLTAEAEKNLLTAADPDLRAQASTQLLAKALTDLTVSAHLLQAALDEEEGNSGSARGARERSISDAGSTEELLQIVVGEAQSNARQERGITTPTDVAHARVALSQTIEDTLALISQRTSKSGQSALAGLFGIGLGQVGQAAGLLGQNIAQVFGQAQKLSSLYSLFRDFAFKAYESIIALLGPTVAKFAGQQVLNWIAEVKEAKFFGNLLEKLYETQKMQTALNSLVNDSQADTQKFVAAIESVEKLSQVCERQIALVDKLLKGIKYLGAVPVAVLPYGALLLATIYVGICGYVVFNGADYVDADRVRFLNRVPGVRQVVEANLVIA
ncbi:MAG: hypothetical protein ND895_11890 [Pyrinomonadaceae bacterium]|nr:hypothetical protein [Pyrinomonadaceae bacterium]